MVKKRDGNPAPRFNARDVIKNAVILGLKPHEVRAMPPRDYWLMVQGYNDAHSGEGSSPGANAPSMAEAMDLVNKYG